MRREDSALCRAILAGDTEAEARLALLYRDRIARMVTHGLGRTADADDLANEIFRAVLLNLRNGNFRGDCLLSTYIHAIAQNKVREHLRRRRPEPVEIDEDLPDPGPSPEQMAASSEAALAVRQALRDLGSRHRRVLYLYYYRGLSIGEIASLLGVSARKISQWKDYALKVMRSRSGAALERFR